MTFDAVNCAARRRNRGQRTRRGGGNGEATIIHALQLQKDQIHSLLLALHNRRQINEQIILAPSLVSLSPPPPLPPAVAASPTIRIRGAPWIEQFEVSIRFWRMVKKSARMILITVQTDEGDRTVRPTIGLTGQDTNKCHQLLGRGWSFQ